VWILLLEALGLLAGAAAPPVVAAAALTAGIATQAVAAMRASSPVAVLDLIDIFFVAYGVS
jgi:hypothetical protein